MLLCRKTFPATECKSELLLFSISAADFSAAGFNIAEFKISIQKRQKGEVPGAESIPASGEALVADPALLISDGKTSLLCGFSETDIHLGRIELDHDGLRGVAEYHPAYSPETASVNSQKIIFITGTDPVALWEEYAKVIMKNYHLSPAPRFPRYTVGANWHYYGPTMTEKELDEELSAIVSRNIPLDVYQIDDGWEKDFADWTPNDKWPSGMKRAADKIRAAGMIPGIWITPFLCGEKTAPSLPPHWLLRDANGTPLTMKIGVIPFLILDPSLPEVAEWIRKFLLEIKSWGFTYFKIDFTRCLFMDPAAHPHDRTLTLLQLYRKGIELLRETLGDDCCLNLCGGHEGATIGLADITRTGRDTYGKWDKPDDPPWIRIRQCVMRNWMNNFRMNDPDASIMRINSTPLPEDGDFTPHRYAPHYAQLSQGFLNTAEAETFILNQFLGGGIAEIGERLPDLQEERLTLLRKVVPPFGKPAKPVDCFRQPLPRFYKTVVEPRCSQLEAWDVISAINVEDVPLTLEYPEKFSRPTMVYDLSEMKLLGIFQCGEKFTLPEIPPHGSKVMKFIPLPQARQPFFVADDLHYSGGGVEVDSIKCDNTAITGKLSSPWHCRVKVAAAFPLPDGKSWHIAVTTCDSNATFSLNAVI